MCCSLAGGITVRTLVGAEASRGGLEAILAAAADARSLVNAVLVFASASSPRSGRRSRCWPWPAWRSWPSCTTRS